MSSMASKLIVITGGTKGGLGHEAARLILSSTPHRVLLTLRDAAKADQALSSLERSIPPGAMQRLSAVIIDLLSLESVRRGAKEIRDKHATIDALVLNAAVVPCDISLKKTVDGQDSTFQVNHLSHMLLTHLLMPSLTARNHPSSEDKDEDVRDVVEEANVVVVSSALHANLGSLLPSPAYFRDRATASDPVDPNATGLRLYSLTKLYNLWFMHKLHRLSRERSDGGESTRTREVRVNGLSPGFIPNTNLSSSQGFLANAFMSYVMPFAPFATKKEDGARGLMHLAINKEGHEGLYFTKGQVKEPSALSRDEVMQDELWSISCKAIGISEMPEDFGASS